MIVFRRIIKWLDNYAEECLLIFLLTVIACIMMLQIIMRYVFKSALSWPEEFCRYCFIWSGFLAVGYSIKRNSMLRIDILYSYVPKSFKVFLDVLSALVALFLYAFIMYHGIISVQNSYKMGTVSTAMQIPMYLIYLSVPVGFGIAVIRQIEKIADMFAKTGRKKHSNSTLA